MREHLRIFSNCIAVFIHQDQRFTTVFFRHIDHRRHDIGAAISRLVKDSHRITVIGLYRQLLRYNSHRFINHGGSTLNDFAETSHHIAVHDINAAPAN